MSEKQQQQAEHHLVKAMVIVEVMTELFKKTEDEQRACIVMEALDILPTLESNLSEAFGIITQ